MLARGYFIIERCLDLRYVQSIRSYDSAIDAASLGSRDRPAWERDVSSRHPGNSCAPARAPP